MMHQSEMEQKIVWLIGQVRELQSQVTKLEQVAYGKPSPGSIAQPNPPQVRNRGQRF